MNKNNDYKYIRAWGKVMGSQNYYIEDQVEIAREDKAPQDAIYKHSDGTWATFDNILSPITQCEVEKYLEG